MVYKNQNALIKKKQPANLNTQRLFSVKDKEVQKAKLFKAFLANADAICLLSLLNKKMVLFPYD